MTLLTDLSIRRAKPAAKAYTLKDGAGLYLNIKHNGTKQWLSRFYWQGKQQRISFGSFPDVDLTMARQRREDARTLIASGIDPRSHKEDIVNGNKANKMNFAEHWKAFKLKKLGVDAIKNRQSTRVQIGRYLHKDLLPYLRWLIINSCSMMNKIIVRVIHFVTQHEDEFRAAIAVEYPVRLLLNLTISTIKFHNDSGA